MKIDKQFSSALVKSNRNGSWTRVIMPDSAEFFETKGYVKVKGTIDGHPFETSLMPMGDGTHMFPVKAETRKVIGKDVGDSVKVHLTERLK
jgi:hypothetical protein